MEKRRIITDWSESSINERVAHIIEQFFEGNTTQRAKSVFVKQSTLRDIVGDRQSAPSFETMKQIVANEALGISPAWLLTGEGEMLREENQLRTFVPDEMPKQVGRLYKAPIFTSLPVSAGNTGLSTYAGEEPVGFAYTSMPGVQFFPVTGFSFDPIIPAGSFIGIAKLDNWQEKTWIDPSKIFLIITRDDRMMKRIRLDKEDPTKIWCLSPNFPDFDITKEEILEIHHVFCHGKMI